MVNTKSKKYKQWLKLNKKAKLLLRKGKCWAGQKNHKEYKKLRDELQKYREFEVDFGHSYPRHKGRTKKRDDIQKFKNGDIDEIFNEKIPKEYEY